LQITISICPFFYNQSLMSRINPSNVIKFKTADKVKNIAEDMNIFKEIGIDIQESTLSTQKQGRGNVM